jgi:hypothetical protein
MYHSRYFMLPWYPYKPVPIFYLTLICKRTSPDIICCSDNQIYVPFQIFYVALISIQISPDILSCLDIQTYQSRYYMLLW